MANKKNDGSALAKHANAYLENQSHDGKPFIIVDGELWQYHTEKSRYEALIVDKSHSGREQHHNSLRRRLLTYFGTDYPYAVYDQLAAEIALKAQCFPNEEGHMQLLLGGAQPLPLPFGIVFRNGLLHADRYLAGDAVLEPNGPHVYSRLPPRSYNFDPAAQCPTWLRFIGEVTDAESAKCLAEWFGLCMIDCTKFQKVLCLVGPGGTGKSTVQNVLMDLLGEQAVSNVGLTRLGSQFGQKELIGKLLNVSADVKWVQDMSEDILKAISGQDRISIDRKHMDAISVRLPARLMLVGNGDPRFHDSSGAILRRLLVLRFENVVEKKDNELLNKLRAELPGICNWALEGLRRLFEQNAFTVSPAMQETLDELRTSFNPIEAFVEECLDIDPNGKEATGVIFGHYQMWAEAQGIKSPLNDANFGRELRVCVPGVTRKKQGNGSRQYWYHGVTLPKLTIPSSTTTVANSAKPTASAPAAAPQVPDKEMTPVDWTDFWREERKEAEERGLTNLTKWEVIEFYDARGTENEAAVCGKLLMASKDRTPEEVKRLDEENAETVRREAIEEETQYLRMSGMLNGGVAGDTDVVDSHDPKEDTDEAS